jgi:hypothetical protein
MPTYKLVATIMLLSVSYVFADAIKNLNTANGDTHNHQQNTKALSNTKAPAVIIEDTANGNKPNYQQNTKTPSAIIENKEPKSLFSKSLFQNQEHISATAGDKAYLTKTLAELLANQPVIRTGGLSSNCQIRFLVGLNNTSHKGRISGFLLGTDGNSSSNMIISPLMMSHNLRFGIPLSSDTEKNCWRMFVPQSFSIETALKKKLNATRHNKRLLYILKRK